MWQLFRRVNYKFPVYSISTALPKSSKFQVLFEDEHLIAINKPAHMLSVPGRGEVALSSRLPRSDEWRSCIVAAQNILWLQKEFPLSPISKSVLAQIVGRDNVPRTASGFATFIKKTFTTKLKNMQGGIFENASEVVDLIAKELWGIICAADELLHSVPYESIPQDVISIATILTEELGVKVFHVHRLDQETTGVLVFAKHSIAAEGLCKQFRDRNVSVY